jgi:hypothetical protein
MSVILPNIECNVMLSVIMLIAVTVNVIKLSILLCWVSLAESFACWLDLSLVE